MKNFLSICNIWVKRVELEENRKNFNIGVSPDILEKSKISYSGITNFLKCENGFKEFLEMLDLYSDENIAETGCNLLDNVVKCVLIFYEGNPFAISDLALKKCFVLDFGKNYSREEIKKLAKIKKRQELLSFLNDYNARTEKALTELSELEVISLEFQTVSHDKKKK